MIEKKCEILFRNIKLDFNKLYHSLNKLEESDLNSPMTKGKWNIIQTLDHLNFSFSSTIGYINKKIQYPETIKSKNFISTLKSKLINTLLRTNLKFKGPQIITTKAPNNFSINELENTTTKHLESLYKLLDTFPISLQNKNVFKHPIANYITIKQTLEFLHEHLLHHIRQIENYLNKK